MRIVVVGAGAMGSLFGGLLAESGQDVVLVDVWQEHVDAIQRSGLELDVGGEIRRVPVAATSDTSDLAPADVVIVFVKHRHTHEAARSARDVLGPETQVWTLQNGIGNVDILSEEIPRDRLVKGLTTATAIVHGPGRIESNFSGETATYVYPVDADKTGAVQRSAKAFTEAGLQTHVDPGIDLRIWRKLVINAGLTALAAVVPVRIGEVARPESGREILQRVSGEVVEVAQAHGVDLTLDEALDYLDELAEAADRHVGSMTIDVLSRRPTEIDAMNGAVVRLGRRHGVPTPANWMIQKLIHLTEATYDQRLHDLSEIE